MNLRVIRQRIRSVQNTQKITKAMEMVAGAKLRRAHEELLAFRPYALALEQMARRFLAAHPGLQHPLLEPQKGPGRPGTFRGKLPGTEAPAGLVVVSSDTGLCGTYNERLIGAAEGFLREFPSAVLVTIGKKGTRHFARRGVARAREILDWGGRYDARRAGDLLGWLESRFLGGKVSCWSIAYTQFLSALSWRPVVKVLLPVERNPESVPGGGARINPGTEKLAPPAGTEPGAEVLPEKVIVEPDAARFADAVVREFVRTQFGRVLLEAFTAEHSARMVAMKNATENAEEMIGHLTLVRNKARQAAITKELIEVVSGAEALK